MIKILLKKQNQQDFDIVIKGIDANLSAHLFNEERLTSSNRAERQRCLLELLILKTVALARRGEITKEKIEEADMQERKRSDFSFNLIQLAQRTLISKTIIFQIFEKWQIYSETF